MAKFDKTILNLDSSLIFIFENRYSKIARYGSDFAFANEVLANSMIVSEPKNKLSNSAIAMSVGKNGESQDISFYYANLYLDNKSYRSNMLGFAYNKAIDNFLFKTEIAYFDNYDGDISSLTNSSIGIEYSGISDGSISFELANKENGTQQKLKILRQFYYILMVLLRIVILV